jgi:GGDEF domain-containing protein
MRCSPSCAGDDEAAAHRISVYPGDGDDVDTLIACADAAMDLAKKVGPGGFAFHGQQPPREPIESFVAALRREGWASLPGSQNFPKAATP